MGDAGAEIGIVGVGGDLVAGFEDLLGAGEFDELVLAAAACEFGRGEGGGGVEGAEGEVFAQENIEAAVDGAEGVVADEDEGVEALEDHADFCYAVPAVVAACWHVKA